MFEKIKQVFKEIFTNTIDKELEAELEQVEKEILKSLNKLDTSMVEMVRASQKLKAIKKDDDNSFWIRISYRETQKARRYKKQSDRKGRILDYLVKQGHVSKELMKKISEEF